MIEEKRCSEIAARGFLVSTIAASVIQTPMQTQILQPLGIQTQVAQHQDSAAIYFTAPNANAAGSLQVDSPPIFRILALSLPLSYFILKDVTS